MTDQYARGARFHSRLDKRDYSLSRCPGIDRCTGMPLGAHILIGEPVSTSPGYAISEAMATRDLITEKLTKAFAPHRLEVLDESHQHVGHAGHRPGGETHFRVHVVSDAFRGKSRLERHRMVNHTLSGELAGGVHALAIHASAPGEES